MLKYVPALLIMLTMLSCGAFGQGVYGDITVNQADSLIKARPDSSVVILDVRTPGEYEKGHLKGAVMVNFLKRGFNRKLSKLDRDKAYIVYCKSGGRSAKTLTKMKKRKFREAYNMLGGIRDWTKEGYDIIIEDQKN
jgi:rhodanese-related sulfurtransferase